ncbi:putative heparinase superfamily protein [Sagittula marina]|uniref:Putative heparinase superfamily protein n=1 Tax=Sagittula marina TaxID=943940 RepID=A0A7W6DSS2_9RHOB|nr:heparinase II/III family protein [Sagittula marina]MBB3988448.1 putative heparinase superfamily protein [Sagittula marina]
MSALRKAGLYWHTLKYLKPVQFTGRLRFRLARPVPDLSPAPPFRAPTGTWVLPAARTASLTGPDQVLFLGQPEDVTRDSWDSARHSKLWRYNLHYFDDLNAEGAAARRDWQDALITRWIVENPPGPVADSGSGWEPYPVSLRIVNWVKVALSGHPLPEGANHSLAVQARWLTQRLEWHLLGNHLFANAKALMYAGLFFEGPEADGWRRIACDILLREIPEQILPDGGQFELTPMYHAIALEDVLDLVNLCTAFDAEPELRALCRGITPGMIRWLRLMSHPDGGISFFNDAAFGIAPETRELLALAARLELGPDLETQPEPPDGVTLLPDSGFARLANAQAVVLCDVGDVGPDYLPGHAHADTLSSEVSIHGQRVIVNAGTSEYGTGTERLRQRGTAAHATVTYDGQDSSEVWGGFRVARRARVHDIEASSGDAPSLSARHDGYTRLPSGPMHQRRWTLYPSQLTIADTLTPTPTLTAENRFPLHPHVTATLDDATSGIITLPGGQVLHWRSQSPARLESVTWHPHFGASVAAQCLCLDLSGGRTALDLYWS